MAQQQMIFLIGAPRSGTTLLQRMLGSHSAIYTHPEPHLITPLAYLGFYDTVLKAPYDHLNAAEALRELVQELPRGEDDYLDALRAYSDTIYERVLAPTGKRFFLDKTPAYALVLPFLVKLYPNARYVVLSRHPMALWHSQAHSFFGGDYVLANQTNPVVVPYVTAIARFMRERAVPFVHTRYEDLVRTPERELRRLFEHLDLPFEAQCIDYGKQQHLTKSYGDPMSVERHTRPVADLAEQWASDFVAKPEVLEAARALSLELADDDLALLGYPRETLFAALEGRGAEATRAPALNGYQWKRQVLLSLKKNLRHAPVHDAVRKVRYYCDVLLRE